MLMLGFPQKFEYTSMFELKQIKVIYVNQFLKT